MHSILRGATACSVLIACSQPASAGSPRSEQPLDQLYPKVQIEGHDYSPRRLADEMERLRVPGISIVFIDKGRIAWTVTRGWADREARRRVNVRTLFQAASMSKAVTASAALTMVDEGKLALDRPVNQQLHGWTIPENDLTAGHPVTLRHLVTHRAGLTVSGFTGYSPGKPLPDLAAILSGAAPANNVPVVVNVQPGSINRYSGGGFTVVQKLIGDVSGKPFDEVMKQRVLAPLGMADSGFMQPLPKALAGRAATAYRYQGDPLDGRYNSYPELAAAGLWTTPTDLARWVIAIQGGYARRAGAIPRPPPARAMLTPDKDGWGLGVSVAGSGRDLRFFHGGANFGFRGMMIGLPERRQGLVVMTNGDRGQELAAEIIQAIAKAQGWSGFDPVKVAGGSAPPDELLRYEGVYRSSSDSCRLERSPAGDTLLILMGPVQIAELLPLGNGRFVDSQSGVVATLGEREGRMVFEIRGIPRIR